MISKPKKLLYGAALVISSGLFANEVVNATQREAPPEPIERPAEAQTNAGASASLTGPAMPTPTNESTTAAGATAPQNDPLAALETALSKLAAADAGVAGELETEAPRPRRKRTQPAEASEGELVPTSVPTPRNSSAARAERRERITKLFEEQPLVGVVSGPDGTLALVGGRSVGVGDLLGDGETRLLECTTAGIRVEFEGEPAWIALPGLRAPVKSARSHEGAAGGPPPPVARNAPQPVGNGAAGGAAQGGAANDQGAKP